MLSFFGIKDYQVEKLNITPFRAAIQLIKRVIQVVIMAGLGTPALVSNLPLIWITSHISKRMQKKALAGSSVKIEGKDVLATWKVIVAAFAAPALYGLYSLAYLLFLMKRRPNLSLIAKLRRAAISWAIQPILHYLLMRLGDTGLDIYRSIRPLFLAIRNPEAGEIIRSIRADLSTDITNFVNEHAPELGVEINSGASSSGEVSRTSSSSDLIVHGNHQHIVIDTQSSTDDMPESFLVSSRDESFIEYESTDESKYQVESIVLDEEESSASPLSQI